MPRARSSRSSSSVGPSRLSFIASAQSYSRAVLDTFKNLRDGVNDGRAAAFVRDSTQSARALFNPLEQMWEHFTTKPFLSELRFIDHVLTPWSSWLIVAPPTLTSDARLTQFLADLSASIHAFDAADARKGSSKEFILGHFGYEEEDVEAWLETVRYPTAGVEVVERATIVKTLK